MRKTLSCGEAPLFHVILLTSDFGIAPASTFHAPRPMTTNKCGLVKVCGGFATTGPWSVTSASIFRLRHIRRMAG
jgi:hypothetical protein